MDGFSFGHHPSPAHHQHHHHQQQHHQQQTHHHAQAHQHQHATHGHHDPTAAAAAGLSAGNAHNHAHAHQAHQHGGAASTPTGGTHHASHATTYNLGSSTLEDLVTARTQLVEAVNRLSQAYRASYEATEQFQRIVQRASNQALTTFFSTGSSPFVSGDFAMTSFFGLDAHGAGNGLGSLHSGMVSANPQAGTTAMPTSYASLAQGNANTPTAQTPATSSTTAVGTTQASGAASGTATAAASGEKKGRRSKKDKKERDPNAPKRPPSAYILFQNDVRDTTRREMPDMSYTGVLGKISTMWKLLSEEERNAYTEKRKRLMAEYTVIKKQYHARVAASGGVVKDDSDSEEEDGDDAAMGGLANAAGFGTNGTPNRLLSGVGIAPNGLSSPSSVDPQALKKRKIVQAKDAAVGKRAKR
ncbi:hypothetical protein CF327_g6452 [Tilletia walkeri]|uniref:HMG box domain-containing protein n=1 Tax=Tilletia walkeri TaxID=117179 RepID=A0A8X7N3W5_9BASI|nr:hypothetical protein CF327_g6452 [Tilletia walkeri]KAE8266581.1 hypothetical protein A4X09_0g5758 [Tilletia walkeri]